MQSLGLPAHLYLLGFGTFVQRQNNEYAALGGVVNELRAPVALAHLLRDHHQAQLLAHVRLCLPLLRGNQKKIVVVRQMHLFAHFFLFFGRARCAGL